MTAMFTRPGFGSGVPAGPSREDRERTRDAYVRTRLAEIQATNRRPMNKAVRRLGRATARYMALEARMEMARRRVDAAEQANAEVHRTAPSPRGSGYDAHSRALGLIGLAVILAICVVADYLVDRSAMQVLLLPLRITQALALFVAIVQMGAAHTVGRLLRRQKEVVDEGSLRHERTKMRLLIGFLATTVVGMAALRAVDGSLLLAAVMFGVGASAAVVAVTASYLHANTRMDALAASERALRWRTRATARTGRRLVRAEADLAVRRNDFTTRASTIATAVDLVYTEHRAHLNGSEPAWLGKVRHWAAGHDLPAGPPPGPLAPAELDPLGGAQLEPAGPHLAAGTEPEPAGRALGSALPDASAQAGLTPARAGLTRAVPDAVAATEPPTDLTPARS